MLGRRHHLDEDGINRAAPKGRLVRLDRDLREQIGRGCESASPRASSNFTWHR